MTSRGCTATRPQLSARLDEALTPDQTEAVEAHLAGCADCRAFAATGQEIRQALRFESVGEVPDVTSAVLERLAAPTAPTVHALPAVSTRRRRVWLPAAAAFVVGLLIGALAISGSRTPTSDPAMAATLPERVAGAQLAVRALRADVTVIEHGRPGATGPRTLTGSIAYRGPESLSLSLREAGTTSDVRLVAHDDERWTAGPKACPSPGVAGTCGVAATAVNGRPPFATTDPVALDLVVPVQSFARARDVHTLGERTIDGRRAVGVETTAAQLRPLLDGLVDTAGLRPVFPSDRAQLWLDADAMVPLALEVRATDDLSRRSWEQNHQLTDEPGQPVLEVTLTRLEINGPVPDAELPPPPAGAAVTNSGFVDGEPKPDRSGQPGWVPDGFVAYRAGTLAPSSDHPVTIRSWADGRAWFTITSTEHWSGGRLFGDVGSAVRAQALDNGLAYTDDQAAAIAIHGDGIDVVVRGTVAPDQLRRIAGSLPVRGSAVPTTWPESATASLTEARRADPALLVAHDLPGIEDNPAVRIDPAGVTLRYAGAGDRSFTLTQGAGHLSPPSDQDASPVQVRGTLTGRYSAEQSELEWVDGDRVFSLRSSSFSAGELLAIARRLGPP